MTSASGGYAGIESRFLLSTFGLLSPGKGIEVMLDALPAIVELHPNVLYVVAGRTHPQVARRRGEEYRLMLERRIADLDLAEHVVLDDRFLEIDELADLLAATDVFVTPYANREQSSSGALTFALAAGCAVVSTPYWYASDMLASGAGKLVGFGETAELGAAIFAYISEPETLAAARGEAARVGATFGWPAVAAETAAVLREAIAAAPRRAAIPDEGLELARGTHRPPPDARRRLRCHSACERRDSQPLHRLLRGRRGSSRHRRSGARTPDRRQGVVGHPLRSLAFLSDATDDNGKGMRNFMTYDRRWLDDAHVGDHVGRAIWSLGDVLTTAWVPALVEPARRVLASLVGSFENELPLRTAAYTALGLARLDVDRRDSEAHRLLERCVTLLEQSYAATAGEGWLWFEDALRYDNARLSQALILGGVALDRPEATATGLTSLAWLGDECGLVSGMLRLPGHGGRRRGESGPGAGDEQPLDASALVEAELSAFAVTGDVTHGVRARLAFEWFLGRNRLGRPLYDFATGGCRDGLGEEDVNGNEGAESTLAFHRAQLVLDAAGLPRVVRARVTPVAP